MINEKFSYIFGWNTIRNSIPLNIFNSLNEIIKFIKLWNICLDWRKDCYLPVLESNNIDKCLINKMILIIFYVLLI